MARRKESEKAATPLSDLVFEHPADINKIKELALSLENSIRREDRMRSEGRTGLCALRDACNVLIWQGAEADMEAQSEHLKALEAEVAKKVKAS